MHSYTVCAIAPATQHPAAAAACYSILFYYPYIHVYTHLPKSSSMAPPSQSVSLLFDRLIY